MNEKTGEWQTVWTTLVVRLWYSQELAHRELWRNAAEFESARKQTLGLKITKTGDGAATISLYFDMKVPDELKVIFIEYVHRHLAKYACEVSRDRRYVCPECGTPVKDLDAVRRRLEAKKDFITCQECDERVPFVDFIEQRLKSDPAARKIAAVCSAQKVSGLLRFWRWTRRPRAHSTCRRWSNRPCSVFCHRSTIMRPAHCQPASERARRAHRQSSNHPPPARDLRGIRRRADAASVPRECNAGPAR